MKPESSSSACLQVRESRDFGRAEVSKAEIPELAESLDAVNKQLAMIIQPKPQTAIEVANKDIMDSLTAHLQLGWKLAHSLPSKPGFTILVFETY